MQITSAMILLDKKNVMHLDLKPENILYQNKDYFKICDFGCAQIFQNLSKIGHLESLNFGTPKYISPQIASGRTETKKSSQDIQMQSNYFTLAMCCKLVRGIIYVYCVVCSRSVQVLHRCNVKFKAILFLVTNSQCT